MNMNVQVNDCNVSDLIVNNHFNTDAISNLLGMDLDWDRLAKFRSNDTKTLSNLLQL